MIGIIFAIMAGVMVSVQSVFNTKVSETLGMWRSSAVVHFIGFVTALSMMMIMREPMVGSIKDINKWYLLGGSLGALVVFSVMQGMSRLGAGYTTAIMVVAQLVVALLIDYLGLFGMAKTHLSMEKIIGLSLMVIGIFIFQRQK